MTESDLHDYQRFAVEHIEANTHCALLLDMGLGKTVSTLTAINRLMYGELDISSALVVAPKRVAEKVWTDEARKWAHLRHLRMSVISGNERQRKAALAAKADIHLISRDNVAWLCGQFGGSMLPFDMLVLDELSSFKSPKSVRFKALRGVQPSFKRIVGLTGTPAPNGLIDLWSQMWLLDRGQRLGRTLGEYRSKYFTPGKRNGAIVYEYKLADQSDELIHRRIADIAVSMRSSDYLDLKPPEHNRILLGLGEHQAAYDRFEKDQVLRLFAEHQPGAVISAMSAAALSNKLLQFANGAVYDENGEAHTVHDVKLDAAEEIVETASGQPVLIAWTYKHDRDRLAQRLKAYKPRELKTDKDIDDWNAGKIRVLLMHPASGGHGLNLQQGGNILVWFGQTWSLELYQQLNKRLDRQGQTRTVTIHHLLAEGTIDMDVARALVGKTGRQDGLMDAVKARVGRYLRV